jgi:hypothetical protein
MRADDEWFTIKCQQDVKLISFRRNPEVAAVGLAASMRAKTCAMFYCIASRTWPRPFRCVMRCRAIRQNSPMADCLAHGRRQFVEVAANFPEPCRYVLETLGDVYKYDAEAREGKLSFAFALRTFELTPPLSSPAPGNDPRAS